jgi:hypothetical protein
VIGAWLDNDGGDESGSAYLFARSAGTWTEQQKLTTSDAAAFDHFGQAIAVDGTTAVIGATRDDDNGSASGSAYVFGLSETDADGDGVPDDEDVFPNDPTEWDDTDGDGVGNNADTDDDNDDMPDDFELANGLDPLDEADAAGDADGDGFTNLEEFEAGTDPQDPESKPSRDLSWLFLLLLGEQE